MRDDRGKSVGPRGVSRRKFLKLLGIGGAVAAAGGLAGGYLTGVLGPRSTEEAPWEVAPGVVDYDLVPPEITSGTLRVAQWFDYWPGSFILDFEKYIQEKYGATVRVEVDIYTSNEELWLWLTLNRREYDVFFPSNYYVELMNNADLVYNLNPDWLPNVGHIDPGQMGVPQDDPYDRRTDGSLIALPYYWGTTGMAWNTDNVAREDVEGLGWDFFHETSYDSPVAGETLDLVRKMSLLEDQRDVLMMGFKGAGWEWQIEEGMTPTPFVPPDGSQWTSNETDPARIAAGENYLLEAKPQVFAFESAQQGVWLIQAFMYLAQAWNGDIANAKQPQSPRPNPIDFAVPYQGGSRWIDAMAIQSTSRNLFLAHEFMNFIHDPQVNRKLTDWNLYPTPNLTAKEMLSTYPGTGYDPREDPLIYQPPEVLRRCDFQRDVGVRVLQDYYFPIWSELQS